MATSLGFCFHVYEVGGREGGSGGPKTQQPPNLGARSCPGHCSPLCPQPPDGPLHLARQKPGTGIRALAPDLHGQRTVALAAGASALLFLPVSEGGAGEPALSPGAASAPQ